MSRPAAGILVIIAVVGLTATFSVADTPHQVSLPLLAGSGPGDPDPDPTPITPTPTPDPPPTPTPPPDPDVRIVDQYGVERDWDWVVATYGAVDYRQQPGGPSLVELREIEGPSTLIADVGRPGVEVVFYWPDAPLLSPEQQNCGLDRGLIVAAKENGRAEFVMGGGSYYFPPEGGPHWIWVLDGPQPGDCLGGIGMLGLTNHKHLDSVWRLVE